MAPVSGAEELLDKEGDGAALITEAGSGVR